MRALMENSSQLRTKSLSRGEHTFTTNRLASILQNERFSYDHRTHPDARAYGGVIYAPTQIRCEIDTGCFQFEQVEDGGLRCYGNDKTNLRAMEFCRRLYGHDSPASIAVADLDAEFSKLFQFKFEPLKDSRAFVEQAGNLLERMPAWPPELMDTPTAIPFEYHASSVVGSAPKDARLWEQLQTTTYVSATVLRAALAAVMDRDIGRPLLDMINIIATLLEMILRLLPTNADASTSWRSFIARAFLWTTWQRCQLIYFHLAAAYAVMEGSPDGKKGELALRGTLPSPDVTVHEMSRRRASSSKPSYMCSWNFELLRINPVCIGADFRRFFQLYDAAFENYSARCLVGRSYACKGDSPQSCQRFYGMVIEDQSAHDQGCSGGCRQLVWDEMSYRVLSGARAACLTQHDSLAEKSIRYCNASDQTLAISHVWSHGQGGRPETGFNHCLHLRYSNIARSLDCCSYWIDATCIPSDHQLRGEAIANINETFMNAKVMLVCDKDLMKLDVSNMTTSVCETLLVTIAVSDWNCRAWTFLEAFRARRTIHLLCRNNAVVSLKQVIETVHRNGMLEFGILCLAMPHFLPSFDDSIMAEDKSGGSRQEYQAGYLPIETSGELLSHRPASRPGDDVVIWSLLMSKSTIFHDAETFWKALQGPILQRSKVSGTIVSHGAWIRTGYLVSSAPRLQTRSLTWAPASPTLRFSSQSAIDGLSGYDGGISERGWITLEGLVADWFLWKFDSTVFRQQADIQWQRNLAKITSQYLQSFRWGAILCPIEERGVGFKSGNWWEDGGRLRRKIFVVCGINEMDGPVVETYTFNSTEPRRPTWEKNSKAVGWEWRGIYVWDDSEPLPDMQRVKKFLIV